MRQKWGWFLGKSVPGFPEDSVILGLTHTAGSLKHPWFIAVRVRLCSHCPTSMSESPTITLKLTPAAGWASLQQALVSWTSILWDQLASDETPDYVLGWGNPSGMISCSYAPMGCRINEEIVWEFASVAFPWWHLCTDKKHLAAFLCFVHDVTVLILPDNFMRAATVSNGVHQGLRQLINWEKQGNNRIFPPNPGSPQLLLH